MRVILTFIERMMGGFLTGERRWGCARFLFVFVFLFLFTGLSHLVFEEYSVSEIVNGWLNHYGVLKLIPRRLLQFLVLVIWDFRFLWISLAGFLGAALIGARYLKDIYSVRRISSTFNYLLRSMFAFLFPRLPFSMGYPRIQIDDGELKVNDEDFHPLKDIGGPGFAVVQPGNVVLYEHLHAPSKVTSEGAHLVSRFETIRRFKTDKTDIIILDEQDGYVEHTTAISKDGLQVIVKDIHYRYRLRSGREFGDYVDKDPGKPNPYSTQAVYDMAYKRIVRSNGLTPWHDTINLGVDGAITDYIREHQFDDVTAPRFPDKPRDKIAERIFSKSVRDRLRAYGAELLWWDIGHFEIADPRVARELVSSWGTLWDGEAAVRLAQGEAKRLEYLERGRAEAQAEMLVEIIKSFEEMELLDNPQENIRHIILARVAQLLDGMGGGNMPPPRELPPPSL